MKVRELLTDENKWTKGWNARTVDYSTVPFDSRFACCWCLMGAIHKCYPSYLQSNEILTFIRKELEISPQWANADITSWNDASERTFSEVKGLVNKLNI